MNVISSGELNRKYPLPVRPIFLGLILISLSVFFRPEYVIILPVVFKIFFFQR
jgi:hypothetical protein